MKLLYNPFKKKKETLLWSRIRNLGNFTWKNKEMIDKLQNTVTNQINHVDELWSIIDKTKTIVDEMSKNQKFHAEQIFDFSMWKKEMLKPKKRGRPRKNG